MARLGPTRARTAIDERAGVNRWPRSMNFTGASAPATMPTAPQASYADWARRFLDWLAERQGTPEPRLEPGAVAIT